MAGECPDAMPLEDIGYHSYFAYLEVDDIGLKTVDGHRLMFGCEQG